MSSTSRLPIYVEHVDLIICKDCGGACCKAEPGAAVPEDFGAPDMVVFRDRLTTALRSGSWVVRRLRAPFVTISGALVRVLGDPQDVLYASPAQKRTGSCVFWSRRGCTIFETRPTGCRTLRPVLGSSGPSSEQSGHDARAFVLAWALHQDLVRDVQRAVAA